MWRRGIRSGFPILAETVAQNVSLSSQNGGWGGDRSNSPIATSTSWFERGGQATNGADAGVFAFYGNTGDTNAVLGWRVPKFDATSCDSESKAVWMKYFIIQLVAV